uniref:Uncharacterized protein n=1 Tax=Yersinia ruckeri TaxID=29486 RepID=A0A0A8VEC6_YERRU|nr:hypothetical protein CSF007_2660 [Yersinia ruckeri]
MINILPCSPAQGNKYFYTKVVGKNNIRVLRQDIEWAKKGMTR